MPCFSAYRSTAQTVSSNVQTKVTMTTKEFDLDGSFDIATSRFQPTIAGYYSCSVSVLGKGSTVTSIVAAYPSKNSSAPITYPAGVGSYIYLVSEFTDGVSSITKIIYLNGTTDYVECWVNVVGAGTITVEKAVFQAHYITGA